jgi:hypothetical protein
MAGMDWFRWHHGSVNDPKFQLVAKQAGATVAEVVAVWACLLEASSMANPRGNPGDPDLEAMDCALGLPDGRCASIYGRMSLRGLVAEDGSITSWEKRQPRREREDDSTERVQAFRQRQRHETPSNATERQETPREEKSREEKEIPLAGFVRFWDVWPKSDRKQAKGKCLEAWKKAGAEPHAALIVSHVEKLAQSPGWTKQNGEFIPAPLVYLNRRSWEGAETDSVPDYLKGAINT